MTKLHFYVITFWKDCVFFPQQIQIQWLKRCGFSYNCVLLVLLSSRLFADILNDIAMFIEILAPYYPPLFTLIVCIAGVFKVHTVTLNHWFKRTRYHGYFFMLCIFIYPNHFFSSCIHFIHFISSLQSIVGVAGGATRAALTVHQARRNNMADISAKDGSQVSRHLVWFQGVLQVGG